MTPIVITLMIQKGVLRIQNTLTPRSLTRQFLIAPKHLYMLHNNIRSATRNSANFSYFLKTLNLDLDIIALSETWLSERSTNIAGFDMNIAMNATTEIKKNKINKCK